VGDSNTVGKRAASGNDYPAVLSRLLGSGYVTYNKGVGGTTMSRDGDEPWRDEEEYDDARDIVDDAHTAVVVSIFGTNDAKAENWDDIKDDWKDEYENFINVWKDLGATVIIGVPVPYLGNDDSLGVYKDMWAEIDECPINNDMVDLIYEIAAENNVEVVDAQQAFISAFEASSVNDWETFEPYYADRVHPLDKGLDVLAAAVYEKVVAGAGGYARCGAMMPRCSWTWAAPRRAPRPFFVPS